MELGRLFLSYIVLRSEYQILSWIMDIGEYQSAAQLIDVLFRSNSGDAQDKLPAIVYCTRIFYYPGFNSDQSYELTALSVYLIICILYAINVQPAVLI